MSLRRKPNPCGCNRLCECHKPRSQRSTLKRSGPMKRTAPLRSSGSLRAVSKKQARLNRQRATMRAEHFGVGQDRPACAIRWDENCTRFADGLHEIKKRSRSGSITDPANCIPACNYCNGKVEDEPIEALRRGFAKHSWED